MWNYFVSRRQITTLFMIWYHCIIYASQNIEEKAQRKANDFPLKTILISKNKQFNIFINFSFDFFVFLCYFCCFFLWKGKSKCIHKAEAFEMGGKIWKMEIVWWKTFMCYFYGSDTMAGIFQELEKRKRTTNWERNVWKLKKNENWKIETDKRVRKETYIIKDIVLCEEMKMK